MKTPRLLVAISIFLSPALIPAAHALLIDSFATPQDPPTGGANFDSASGPGILGGVRNVSFVSFPASSAFSIASNVLTLTQSSGYTDIVVTYDGSAGSSLTMGLGGINLLASGTAFQFNLLSTSSTSPHAHLWVTAYTNNSNFATTHLVFDASVFPSNVVVPFSSLTSTGSPDFTSINAIQVELAIGSNIAMDYRIGNISVIPEPSALAFLACATLFLSRRKMLHLFRRTSTT